MGAASAAIVPISLAQLPIKRKLHPVVSQFLSRHCESEVNRMLPTQEVSSAFFFFFGGGGGGRRRHTHPTRFFFFARLILLHGKLIY